MEVGGSGRVARQEHGSTSRASARLNVNLRVADHPRSSQVNPAIAGSIQEHSRRGLAAAARRLRCMWTVVDRIDLSPHAPQGRPELLVEDLEVIFRDQAFRDAALVGDDDNVKTSVIEPGNGVGYTRQDLHILPARDVAPFRSLAIDDAVTVEKHCFFH